MNTDQRPAAGTLAAAGDGDGHAVDPLIADVLPLVYNIAGRALDGDADTGDVVGQTLLRLVQGPPQPRGPEHFRSWLVQVTVRRVRDRWGARQAGPHAAPPAEPQPDFVDLTIRRLGLSGQRAEVAEATRWLEPDDRDVLSLWWLEATGELTRAEVAAGCGLTPQHAAVRVQRMKARLDAARGVVRALGADPRCADLAVLLVPWDGRPGALWRKRIARHTRECPVCAGRWAGLYPADALLAGLGLVPLPAGFAVAQEVIRPSWSTPSCPTGPSL